MKRGPLWPLFSWPRHVGRSAASAVAIPTSCFSVRARPAGESGHRGSSMGTIMIRQIAVGLLALASGLGAAQAQSGGAAARGKYLVDTVMTCHNCHTPRG